MSSKGGNDFCYLHCFHWKVCAGNIVQTFFINNFFLINIIGKNVKRSDNVGLYSPKWVLISLFVIFENNKIKKHRKRA